LGNKMKYEVKAEYTETLVKTATRRFICKFLGWDYVAMCMVMLVASIVLLALGRRDWLVGALGMLTVLSTGMAVMLWLTFHRRALATLRKMTTPAATFTFDDDGIAVFSDLSTGMLKWRAVQKVWCFPEVWLLFVDKGVYSTLPTACLTDAVKTFIIERLKEQGTKISQHAPAACRVARGG
jgi:hypothetical protein